MNRYLVLHDPSVDSDILARGSEVQPTVMLDRLDFCGEDFIRASKKMKSNSAPGPDGIPAILLKKTIDSVAEPLKQIWTESLQSGVIPGSLKTAKITPIL